MRRFIAFLLLAASIFLSPGCKTSAPVGEPVGEPESGGDAVVSEVTELVVLHTNDFHGHPVSFFNYPAPDVGGLPAIATLVRQIRETHENVLLLDAGDLNTGRSESNFFKAEPDLIGYNYLGYDAMVLGNHEFDNSPSVLERQMDLATFPFLSANVTWRDGSYVVEAPYIIKDFKGLRVGIFGLTIKETEVIGNPDHIGEMIFHDEVQTARRVVAKLKDKTHIIIALTHLGIYGSNDRGSRRLAAQVSEGVSFTLNYETKRCENVMINGGPIDANRTYRIVTNSYMAAGGDGYSVFKKAVSKYDTSAFQRDVMIDYIIHQGGRITIKHALGIALSSDAAPIVPWASAAVESAVLETVAAR